MVFSVVKYSPLEGDVDVGKIRSQTGTVVSIREVISLCITRLQQTEQKTLQSVGHNKKH